MKETETREQIEHRMDELARDKVHRHEAGTYRQRYFIATARQTAVDRKTASVFVPRIELSDAKVRLNS
jgi:hypothetical protein